jgi:YD repeat-containing protein
MINSGARTTYTCDAANQLNWLQDATGRTTFSYDGNGNQIHEKTPAGNRITYTWDGGNRLMVCHNSLGNRTTYTYNSSNSLVELTNATENYRISWDSNFILHVDNTLALQVDLYTAFNFANYESTISRRLVNSMYFHSDASTNIRRITIENGDTNSVYDYTYYGQEINLIGNPGFLRFKGDHSFITDPQNMFITNKSACYVPNIGRLANSGIIIHMTDFVRNADLDSCKSEIKDMIRSCKGKIDTVDLIALTSWLLRECKDVPGDWVNQLPACPCAVGIHFRAADRCFEMCKKIHDDGWQDDWFISMGHYHAAACWCIRSKPPTPIRGSEYRARQQCCYDGKGNLITSGDWAGTPDLGGGSDHSQLDVKPYDLLRICGRLDLYFKYRKPNNSNNCTDNKGSPAHKCEVGRCNIFYG